MSSPVTVCGNCGSSLSGSFCHACGQKGAGPDVSLRHVLHEVLEEFAHVDGKILQTLRLLVTRPGMLTKEFLAGRRTRYISPLRLYLTCSLVFFALAAWAPRAERPFFKISKVNGEAGLDPARVTQLRLEATDRANDAIVHNVPRVMFVLMPAFGLLTWIGYRKTRPFYTAHLYYSLHFHAFAFLVLAMTVVLRLAVGQAAVAIAMFVIGPYYFTSLRRVFGGSAASTAWKGAIVWIVYSVVAVASVLAIGIWSARDVI